MEDHHPNTQHQHSKQHSSQCPAVALHHKPHHHKRNTTGDLRVCLIDRQHAAAAVLPEDGVGGLEGLLQTCLDDGGGLFGVASVGVLGGVVSACC